MSKSHYAKPALNFQQQLQQLPFKLYCFDRELRSLITSELEKVEIAVRARIIYVLSEKLGPFGYLNASIYKSSQRIWGQHLAKLGRRIRQEWRRIYTSISDKVQ